MPTLPSTTEFVREYLLKNRKASPYDIFKALAKERRENNHRAPSYKGFYKLFWIMKELGLVRKTRGTEKGRAPIAKAIYTIVYELAESPAWYNPQKYYNPLFALGRDRYNKLKDEAEERGVDIVDAYFEKYQEEVEEIVNVLREIGKVAREKGMSANLQALADIDAEKLKENLKTFGRTIPKRVGRVVRREKRPPEKKPEVRIEIPKLPEDVINEIVTLYEYYEWSPEEIAKNMNLPLEAVLWVIARHLHERGLSTHDIAEWLGIPESVVVELLRVRR